jgi:sulfate transporter permease
VAIEIGLLLAMLVFMRRMIESVHIRVSEDNLPLDLEEQKNLDLQNESIEIPKGAEVYEIEGPFFFGIANQFEETVTAVGRTSRVRIIRMRFVSFMDSTGLHNLTNLVRMCKMNKVHLILSGVNKDVLHTLLSSGLLHELGQENVLPNIHLALKRAQEVLDTEG